MPADVETQLRTLGALWDESVAPVDHDEIVGTVPLARESEAVAPRRRARARWVLAVAGAAAAATIIGVLLVRARDDASTTETATVGDEVLASRFVGEWTAVDVDGSALRLTIAPTGGDGAVEMTVHDTAASVCSGVPSTMTGTGRLDGQGDLVVAVPVLTCDDGSEPQALSGPPLDEQLRAISFRSDAESDTLTDSLGVIWERAGSDAAGGPAESGGMWPQSSIEEVREAQELADAGDPAYTWQVEAGLAAVEWWAHLIDPGAEIVDRFLRDELGWDDYAFNVFVGEDGDGAADGVHRGLVYLRCARGVTNPQYPDDDTTGARCAPTIDELRYETVRLDLSQLDRRGPSGIWVVSRWAMTAPFAQADPQVVAAETTARVEEFLQARLDGEGAEGYVEVSDLSEVDEAPLLYTTSTGATYERFEIDIVSQPSWPYGEMAFTVRMFTAGDETVVEQEIYAHPGELSMSPMETTENGQPLAVPYRFFDGEVTASAPDPWTFWLEHHAALGLGSNTSNETVVLMADPLPVATDCAPGPAPADADALAASLSANPDLVVSVPGEVTVGNAPGLVMDVTIAPGAGICETLGGPIASRVETPDYRTQLNGFGRGSRMRLYLVDLPAEVSTRILAIAVVAPDPRFDAVVEEAAPIVESIEFHGEGE